jgi:arylsulfatase A-like enzyme
MPWQRCKTDCARLRLAARAEALAGRASRRLVALALAVAAAACGGPLPADEVLPQLRRLERPNLVLVVVDTLRADWTTPYGPRATTPELERWGRHGIVFERALAQSSWTKVSMASLMTSLWPRSHGVLGVDDGLGAPAVTLAEALQAAGYRTYGVQSNGWLAQSFGFQQGFDRYAFPRSAARDGPLRSRAWPHADQVYTAAETLLDAHPSDQPFFLYLHFMDVHEYAAPADVPRPESGARGAYLASIAWVDEVLARLRARLAERGLLEHSVLVLASDHGESFGEHASFGHARHVLSDVLHVPLIVRLPFAAEPLRVPAQVRNLDIAPTLLELAGLPVPPGFEGESLLPLLDDPWNAPDRVAHAALTVKLFHDAQPQESTSDGTWTYARGLGGDTRERLFDRRVDPGENVDLAASEVVTARRLRALLQRQSERAPLPGTAATKVHIEPELAQRLRALGYLR